MTPLAAAPLIFLQIEGVSPWPQQPPPEFDHPYHGHLTVRTGTREQIHQWCGRGAGACAMPRGHSCTIVLPIQQAWNSPELFAAYRRHEIGHCNGWRHG